VLQFKRAAEFDLLDKTDRGLPINAGSTGDLQSLRNDRNDRRGIVNRPRCRIQTRPKILLIDERRFGLCKWFLRKVKLQAQAISN
jgi:hypothetical protein